MEASGADVEQVSADFIDGGLSSTEEDEDIGLGDQDYFGKLIAGAVTNQQRIDQAVDGTLAAGWPLEKIDPTLRAVFRAAGAELIEGTVPAKVTINEFVEVAKAFEPDGRGFKLVNGVLDRLAREFRPAEFAEGNRLLTGKRPSDGASET